MEIANKMRVPFSFVTYLTQDITKTFTYGTDPKIHYVECFIISGPHCILFFLKLSQKNEIMLRLELRKCKTNVHRRYDASVTHGHVFGL